jgi:hypothetical protein
MASKSKSESTTGQKCAETQLSVEDGIKRIVDLAARRAVWEKTEYDRSNQSLYKIIDECLALYKESTTGKFSFEMKSALLKHIEDKGYVFKSTTPLSQKIIRCVFGDQDRRRISTYDKVLVAAISNGWNVGEVPSEITKAGGIHMISTRSPSSLMEHKQYQFAIDALKASSIANLTSNAIKSNMKSDKMGEMAVAVMTQMSDGSYNVHCVVHSNKLVRDCMDGYYKTHKKFLQKDQEIQKSTKKSKTKVELIDYAAAAANDSKQKVAA